MRVEMVKINSEKPEPSLIRYAADQIRAGEVLGMPTDTFYGLAADPFNLRAVERVYEIKSRSRHKPLSLLIQDVEQAEELAKPLPEEFHALAKKFWPGPHVVLTIWYLRGKFLSAAESRMQRFLCSEMRLEMTRRARQRTTLSVRR